MSAALLCDHQLDPRLRKRSRWLKDKFGFCDVFVDKTRGAHFGSDEIKQDCISSISFNKLLNYDIVYVSGVKVLLNYFWLFLYLKLKKIKLVYEIPDLPLRSHSILVNFVISVSFKAIVYFLFKKVVITSDAFRKKLPKNIDYFNCENYPSIKIEKKLESVSCEKVTISFVGVVRYFEQMKLLIKYASERDISVNFYGGPDSAVAELKTFAELLDVKNILFFGSFSQEQLRDIYKKTDFIYSVYDSEQENVRLALPNKLYESIIFNKPLIVAKGTYLHETTLSENCGFGVNSSSYDLFCRDMDEGLKGNYSFNTEKLEYNMRTQELEFKKWI